MTTQPKTESVDQEGRYSVAPNNADITEIDVYEHPVKGLCCWADDYGGVDFYHSTTDDGHIPIDSTGFEFIERIGECTND